MSKTFVVSVENFGMYNPSRSRMPPLLRGMQSRKPILRIRELHLEPGKVYAVIGKSGAGKSVLNSFFMRYPAFQNRPKNWKSGNMKIPRICLYLPQQLPDGRNYEMLVEEYLCETVYALFVTCGMKPECQNKLNLLKELRQYTLLEGILDEKKTKRVIDLSGGERRRLELAARLCVIESMQTAMKDTALLILDEPTTGFDWVNQEKFLKEIGKWGHDDKLKNRLTIIVTTHALNRLEDQYKVFDELILVNKNEEKGFEVCCVTPARDIESISSALQKDGVQWQELLENSSKFAKKYFEDVEE